MTKVNKPPTTSNPNIKLKKPSSKEEEFYQPVKKTVITKTPNKVPSDKTKVNSDKKNKDNNAASQPGIFSWLWRYFPKKKT